MSDQDPYAGSWSDWMPTQDQTRCYRERRDETGAYHYEYAASSAVDPAVPRDSTGLEAALGNVSLTGHDYSQPLYHYGQAYDQGQAYGQGQTYDQGSYGYTAAQDGAGSGGFASAPGGLAQHYDMPPQQGHAQQYGMPPQQGHVQHYDMPHQQGHAQHYDMPPPQGPSSSKKDKDTKSKKSSRAPSNKDREKKSSSSKKPPGSSKHKSERVEPQQPKDPFYQRESDSGYNSHSTGHLGPETGNVRGAASDGGDEYHGTGYYGGGPDPTYAAPGANYSAEEDEQEPEQSGHRSRHQSKGKHSKSSHSGKVSSGKVSSGKVSSGKHKQSSSSHPDTTGHPEDDEEAELNRAVENSDAYQPGAVEFSDEEDAGVMTPRAGSTQPGHSAYYAPPSNMASYAPDSGVHPMAAYPSQDLEDEAIQGDSYDGRYVIQPSSRFEPGEVFKILWSEPKGGEDKISSVVEYQSMGRKFYTGYRRFVIVANDSGHCTCVPVLTYERRGCTKPGVKPEKHGIVYPQYGRPHVLPDEYGLGFQPVQLELDYATEKLAKESRINYSKLVTVEHNVHVFFIGRIVAEDFNIVTEAVNKCWADKHRDNNRGGGGGGESSRHRRRPRR